VIYFYGPKDQKVIVSTGARYLEEGYIMDRKPKRMVVIEELTKKIWKQASSIPIV